MLDIGSALEAIHLGVYHEHLEGVMGGENLALKFSLRDIQSSGEFAYEATALRQEDGFKVLPEKTRHLVFYGGRERKIVGHGLTCWIG
jgi:hypothetical protein